MATYNDTHYNDTQIAAFRKEFNEFLNIAKEKSTAVAIHGTFRENTFFPNLQNVRFDALKEEDYPYHIKENSVFLTFTIDYDSKKVELMRGGHLRLSKEDKESDKYKYLAMRGMIEIAKTDYNIPRFRKQTFKSPSDLFNRIESYFRAVMDAVTQYAGSYPYGKK